MAGAQVRQGERATTVVLWKEMPSAHDDDESAEAEGSRCRRFAGTFSAFNLAQVDGYELKPAACLPKRTRLTHAEAFLAALNIPITEDPYDAHYRIDLDRIFLPPFAAFDDAAAHVATLLHEAAHATGTAHRLGRDLTGRLRRRQGASCGRLDARPAAAARNQRTRELTTVFPAL